MLPNSLFRLFNGQSEGTSDQNQFDQSSFDSAQPDAGTYNALNLGLTQSVAVPDGSASTQAGPITTSSQTITTPGSGLVFVNTYTGNVSAQYQSAIMAAETFLESNITNAVTINVTFDTQNGGANGFVGENSWFYQTESYATLKSALISHATSANDLAALASLPATDPTGGAGFAIQNSLAKALGLMSANGTELDDTVYLNTADTYFYSQSNPIAGDYDATSTLEHELTEGMGRVGGLGLAPNNVWGIVDLFRYSAAGQRDYTGGADGKPTFFSINGATLLTQFNNPVQVSGDAADWNHSSTGQQATFVPGGFDSFGAAPTGTVGVVSPTDLALMDVIGWTRSNTTGPNPAINDFIGTGTSDLLLEDGNGNLADWIMQNGGYLNGNAIGNPSSFGYHLIGTGAFNGGGTTDLLLQDSGGNLADWTMQNGNHVGGNYIGNPSSFGFQLIGTGDFNGDGTTDLLLQDGSGNLADWIMQNGNHLNGNDIGNPSSFGYQLVGTGAFNGIGTTDLLLQDGSGNLADWIMQNGNHVGGNYIGNPSSFGYHLIGTGDFNGDGNTDLLLEDNSGNLADWIMQNGNHVGGNYIGNPSSFGYQLIGTGDFNGDGTTDLLLEDSNGNLADWIMQNGNHTGGNYIGNPSSFGYQLIGTGDFNGNGTTDLLLQNSSGNLADWIMQNGSHTGGSNIGNPSSFGYHPA